MVDIFELFDFERDERRAGGNEPQRKGIRGRLQRLFSGLADRDDDGDRRGERRREHRDLD